MYLTSGSILEEEPGIVPRSERTVAEPSAIGRSRDQIVTVDDQSDELLADHREEYLALVSVVPVPGPIA